VAPETVVAAVVHDALLTLGHAGPNPAELAPFTARPERERWLRWVAITCWLLTEAELAPRLDARPALRFLAGDELRDLAAAADAAKLLDDPDRREELARFALRAFDLRPSGESDAQAADRLQSISTVERNRLIAASRAAEQRARDVREALARKAAQEAADKAFRE
jgi:hypothetical protein